MPNETGGQRAAMIKAIAEMGGPDAYDGAFDFPEDARDYWCQATEFLWDRLQEAESRLGAACGTLSAIAQIAAIESPKRAEKRS